MSARVKIRNYVVPLLGLIALEYGIWQVHRPSAFIAFGVLALVSFCRGAEGTNVQ